MNNKENEPIMDHQSTPSEIEDHKLTRSENVLSTPSKQSSPIRNPLGSSNTSPFKKIDMKSNTISPSKQTSSSRVIESLHTEIDGLKAELVKLKSNNEEIKKSYELVRKRRDHLMEQLSNSKHENDTVNSLLQRKQRRINDLESQLNEISSSSDDMKFKLQSLEVRSEKLRHSEASAVAEYERMKIAYETVVTSQKEYREYYSKEIKTLKERLSDFIKNKEDHINKHISLISKSDATIGRSLKSVTNKSKDLEKLYEERDTKLNEKIQKIASINAKNNNEVSFLIQTSKDLFHEIADKLQIDKEELLKTFLDQDSSRIDPFKEEDTPKPQQTSEITVKKRHEKRNISPRVGSGSSTHSDKSLSVEERVVSLDKELNKSIPLKDRIAPNSSSNNSLGRTKSVRGGRNNSNQHVHNSGNPLMSRITPNDSRRTSKNEDTDRQRVNSSRNDSRRSSRIFDDSNSKSRSANASRRSSRIFEGSNVPQVNETQAEPEKKEEPQQIEGASEAPKRKRRRRRRRRGKKGGASQADGNNSDNDEDDDGEEDEGDASILESDAEVKDSKIEETKTVEETVKEEQIAEESEPIEQIGTIEEESKEDS